MATANGTAPPNTYEPKNILVTGGCGFIASHVVIRLVKNYPQYKVRNSLQGTVQFMNVLEPIDGL